MDKLQLPYPHTQDELQHEIPICNARCLLCKSLDKLSIDEYTIN